MGDFGACLLVVVKLKFSVQARPSPGPAGCILELGSPVNTIVVGESQVLWRTPMNGDRGSPSWGPWYHSEGSCPEPPSTSNGGCGALSPQLFPFKLSDETPSRHLLCVPRHHACLNTLLVVMSFVPCSTFRCA